LASASALGLKLASASALGLKLASALDRTSALASSSALEFKATLEACLLLSYRSRDQKIADITALAMVLHGFVLGWLEEDTALFFTMVRKQVAAVIRILSAGDGSKTMDDLLEVYKNLWVQLVILEERRAGRLAAFEGIRIVKKRIPEAEFIEGVKSMD
ncbi:MAG: hypothetical protein K8L99_15555, partial [Anaerolineae bacterium]|nr:hypothetical protein [Anaerolineae bacterium]